MRVGRAMRCMVRRGRLWRRALQKLRRVHRQRRKGGRATAAARFLPRLVQGRHLRQRRVSTLCRLRQPLTVPSVVRRNHVSSCECDAGPLNTHTHTYMPSSPIREC